MPPFTSPGCFSNSTASPMPYTLPSCTGKSILGTCVSTRQNSHSNSAMSCSFWHTVHRIAILKQEAGHRKSSLAVTAVTPRLPLSCRNQRLSCLLCFLLRPFLCPMLQEPWYGSFSFWLAPLCHWLWSDATVIIGWKWLEGSWQTFISVRKHRVG